MARARLRAVFHLGTSGFGYDAWKGSFYPPGVKAKDRLAYYASRFSSVEINFTFRRLASAKTLVSWREATPEGFVFAMKAHMRITHSLRLANAGDAVAKFLDSLEPLGDRVGPILFQCPDHMPFDAERLAAFLRVLRPGHRYAFEFRDASWEGARPMLESHGMSWCVADTDEAPADDAALASGAFHYLRLRRARYTKPQLARWAQRIDAALCRGRDVYCYFKHEDAAKGPRFADRLAAALADCRAT